MALFIDYWWVVIPIAVLLIVFLGVLCWSLTRTVEKIETEWKGAEPSARLIFAGLCIVALASLIK